MKKLLFGLAMLLSHQVYSQCFTTVMITQPSCDSSCSGLAVFTANGGTMPYSLYIDGIGPITLTTQTNWGNLCPGQHTYTVIDATGDTCTGSGNFNVQSFGPLDAQVNVSNASCSTCNDGAATVTSVTGGTPPYTYVWSTGINLQTATSLLPGLYTVLVIDANGCTDQDSVLVGVGATGFYTVGGNVYFDLNSNGIKDTGEPGIGNQQVQIPVPPVSAVSNNNGDYIMVVAPGTYDVAYQLNPAWNLTSVPSTYNVTVTGTSIGNLDFGLFPDSSYASSYCVLTSGWPRCNLNVPYYVSVHNNGFTVLNGVLQFNFDPLQTYVSSSVTPASQAGNQLTYNFTNLAPGSNFTVAVTLTEPGAGSLVNISTSYTATDQFLNTLTDTCSLSQQIACSYDPNDKAVYPEGYGPQHFVEMGTSLDYLIRFQNTGNDTAYNVIVLDTLDADLMAGSFTVTGSSHPMQTILRPGGAIEFRFDNIMLPDSNVNEPASHGFIQYRVEGLASNPDPTIVQNRAFIYFDQNSPVETNTTITTFSDVFLSIHDVGQFNDFRVYPNPFSDKARIVYSGAYRGTFILTMYDLTGREVVRSRMLNRDFELSKGTLAPGSYILKVAPDDGSAASVLRLNIR